jgi:hypothetical protein
MFLEELILTKNLLKNILIKLKKKNKNTKSKKKKKPKNNEESTGGTEKI